MMDCNYSQNSEFADEYKESHDLLGSQASSELIVISSGEVLIDSQESEDGLANSMEKGLDPDYDPGR